jgi:putative nucleotidyltransferase with HDIG domain
MKQADWAEEIARKLLEMPLPRRWTHSQGVAAQARTLAAILGTDADLLEAAAWLHDIGYSPDLVDTDFHPLDGARHLRNAEHADEMLCRLVAHHSCAITEAEERGLSRALLREFPRPPRGLAEALTYCDITTSPDGDLLAVDDRLAEITRRYGPGHVVTRSICRSSPNLVRSVAAVQRRLRQELIKNAPPATQLVPA